MSDLFERYVADNALRGDVFAKEHPLTVVSDYGGKHRSSAVETYAFLVFQPQRHWDVIQSMQAIRARRNDRRRLRYNRLRSDGVMLGLLDEFVPLYKQLDGVLVTLALDKKMQVAALAEEAPTDMHPEFRRRLMEFDKRVQTHVVNVLAILAFLLTGFGERKPRFHWITDEDDLIANLRHRNMSTELLQGLLGNFGCSSVSGGINGVGDNPTAWEDVASIVDLAAGAVAEHVTALVRSGVEFRDHVINRGTSPPRCSVLLDVLMRKPANLKVWTVWIRPGIDGRGVTATRFTRFEIDDAKLTTGLNPLDPAPP